MAFPLLMALSGIVLFASGRAWAEAPQAAIPIPERNDSAPTEVTVHGAKAPRPAEAIGAVTLPAKDTRGIAGTFGEPFQAIAALPGVAATASALPYFYVRGAPPADTGYFIDGVQLPSLFHIGPGPSVVPPALVDRIEFFPSTAPARFGRFAGGVIAATTAAKGPAAHGEGSIRLFDASAFIEAPIGPTTTAFASGRYGYPNLLLSLVKAGLTLEYGDYAARVVQALGGTDTFSVFAIGAYDREQSGSQALVPVDSQFHRIDVRYDRRWKAGSVRVATTLGIDRTSRKVSSDRSEIVGATSGRVRVEFEQQVERAARLSFGGDAVATRYAYQFTAPNGLLAPIDAEQVGGGYIDLRLRPASGVELTLGVRVDAYRLPRWTATSVDPKLAARVALSGALTWISTLGIAHQEPTYAVPVPGLRVDPSSGLQTTYQMAEGLDTRLPWGLRGSLTGFYNVHRNMSDFVADCGSFATDCRAVGGVDGRTFGVEVLLQRSLAQRLGGWLSYTGSRADRRIGNTLYLSPFDRPHAFSAVVNYDFGSGIKVGIRTTYYSGRPSFPAFVGGTTALPPGLGGVQLRLPSFYRLDLRAEKRWPLGHDAWAAVVFDFFNATLMSEAIGFTCPFFAPSSANESACRAETVGPIALPSLGVEGGF